MGGITTKKLGLTPYQTAWDYQHEWMKNALSQRKNNEPIAQQLLLLEHPHVYTLGKSADSNNLLINPAFLKQINAEVFNIDRGGDITYHGPGQLVAYPLLDLLYFDMGVKDYVFALEQIIIDFLLDYDILAARVEGKTGIWIEKNTNRERKIAAIGIKCSRHLTMHGLAFNINSNLDYFQHIIPCGIAEKGVTSLSKELGYHLDMETISTQFETHFFNHFKTNQ